MHFMDKKKRDDEAVKLRAQGKDVRVSVSTNQQLHPMYVEDWPYELSQAEKGFGNTLYRTHFAKLYNVEVI